MILEKVFIIVHSSMLFCLAPVYLQQYVQSCTTLACNIPRVPRNQNSHNNVISFVP